MWRSVGGRPVDWGTRTVDRVAPAVPSDGAAPAEPAPPGKAALIPARAAPGRTVPAVPPAAPDELRLFDRRAALERGGGCGRADAKRGLCWKGEQRDQPRRYGERQGELANHVRFLLNGDCRRPA